MTQQQLFLVGRQMELERLLTILEPSDRPRVTQLHGMPGVGKTSLLDGFRACAQPRSATVLYVNCSDINLEKLFDLEKLSFVEHLLRLLSIHMVRGRSQQRGMAETERDLKKAMGQLRQRLGQINGNVVLILDNYDDPFRSLDSWMRTFIPTLSPNVRVILSGRYPPRLEWRMDRSNNGVFCEIELGPLDEEEALQFLVSKGLKLKDASRINRVVHGHPLALELAIRVVQKDPGINIEGQALPEVIKDLVELYFAAIPDEQTQEALLAASVVRRIDRPLLRTLLPCDAVLDDAWSRLENLPFTRPSSNGLVIHECVREPIAAKKLEMEEPERYRTYRKAAGEYLRERLRTVGEPELWQYTADILYLLKNTPHVRNAFFSNEAQKLTVAPARECDFDIIRAITTKHDGSVAASLLDVWRERISEVFHLVRNEQDEVVGFYHLFEARSEYRSLLENDPVAQSWFTHLVNHPVQLDECVLFFRRWLSDSEGEQPGPVQAACWLDTKRMYMAYRRRRPRLRRVYATIRDIATYQPMAEGIKYRYMPELNVALAGAIYHAGMLDFGPLSVDGWIADLLDDELGGDTRQLDVKAKLLVFQGRPITLTEKEFKALDLLSQNAGKVVLYTDLIKHIWGDAWVEQGEDARVRMFVKRLRTKLQDNENSVIEVRRGIGLLCHRLQRINEG